MQGNWKAKGHLPASALPSLLCRLLQALSSATTSSSSSSSTVHSSCGVASSTTPQQRNPEPLHAAVQVVWPGDSAAARFKRAAAVYLLSQPSFGANSSHVATAVRCQLGTSTQQAGLGPFRQFMQCDSCFRVDNALESEAWIVLLPDGCTNSSSMYNLTKVYVVWYCTGSSYTFESFFL
jgi:hypothetical protein